MTIEGSYVILRVIKALPPNSKMREFLASYGTLILAIYGIVQLWAVAVWKWFFRKATLAIYATPRITIGYATYGPTVAIHGTVRALNRSVFV